MEIYKPKISRQKARDSLGRRNRKIRYIMNYREVKPLFSTAVFKQIHRIWNEVKTPVTGFIDYRTVAVKLHMPIGKLMMYLKGWHSNDPYGISFGIDRMGCNVFFKIKNTTLID